MATHSSILAWRIPWTEEPGGFCPVYREGRLEKPSLTSQRGHLVHCGFGDGHVLSVFRHDYRVVLSLP